MWDRLSEEPSPSKDECVSDISTMILTDKLWWKYKKYYLDSYFLKKIVSNIVYHNSMNSYFDCSLAGYYNFTLPEVKSRCLNKIMIRKQRLIKLRGYVKTIGLIFLSWRSIMEKIYAPDSDFVKACTDKYSDIFSLPKDKKITIKMNGETFGILRSNSF